MQPETQRERRQTRLRPLAAATLLAACCGAWADDDPNPYYIGLTQSFSHDSNVYRVQPNTPVSTDKGVKLSPGDNYWSTGLVGGVDQPFGRQRFYANGNVRLNKFQDLGTLDNTSYGLTTGLDWSTIEHISGHLEASANQNLATYSSTSLAQQLTKKNVLNDELFLARAQWGGISLWTLEGSLSRRQLRYSAEEYRRFELNQDAASVGVRFRPSALLSLGTDLRTTRGRYPGLVLASGADASYHRNDLDFTASWEATGLSTITGRLSLSREHFAKGEQQDFSGATGSLAWGYRPTGKLSFRTAINRDTGQETSFFNLGTGSAAPTAVGDNSLLTTGLTFDATYAASAKIKATAGLRYSHRSLNDKLSASGLAAPPVEGSDSLRRVSFGLSYTPTRNWLLGCNLERDSRSVSSTTPSTLSYPYSVNTVSCSAQFTVQ